MREIDQDFLDRIIPRRAPESHKDDFGRVLAVCGSRGYTGAAYFAAQASVRAGSGVTILCVPEKIYPILAVKLNEPVVCPVVCTAAGGLTQRGAEQALAFGARTRAALIGCGLGRAPETTEAIRFFVRQSHTPLIVDADGISALAGHIDVLRGTAAQVILTPHRGEFSRLIGKPADRVTETDAAAFARATGAIVLLKSHRTLIAAPDGTCFRNLTGNPGMATGGSGDVLAGILLALCGQGIPPVLAACAGARLHGMAGDLCANELGECGMTPTDMLRTLPLVLRRYNSREW